MRYFNSNYNQTLVTKKVKQAIADKYRQNLSKYILQTNMIDEENKGAFKDWLEHLDFDDVIDIYTYYISSKYEPNFIEKIINDAISGFACVR